MKFKNFFTLAWLMLFAFPYFGQEPHTLMTPILQPDHALMVMEPELPIINKMPVVEPAINRSAAFEVFARYPNVSTYVISNIGYPEEARMIGASGAVIVHFEITASGKVGSIDILKSPDRAFDRHVRSFLKNMPHWKPALENGKAVSSWQGLSIDFSLM